jgi:alpha-1,6-mannosyltransferase
MRISERLDGQAPLDGGEPLFVPTTERATESVPESASGPESEPEPDRPRGPRLVSSVVRLGQAVANLLTPEPVPEPYVQGETLVARSLAWPALTGALGSLLVLIGASRSDSPFTLNRAYLSTVEDTAIPRSFRFWFFGAGHPQGNILVGVVLVYAGMFLMIRAWLALSRLTRRYPGMPVRLFVPVFIAWLVPLLVVAPLFSHDAFSYVAQGEEASRNISPYVYPPTVLGVGGNPFASLVDYWWANTTSPYGPVFVGLGGLILNIVHHSYLAALVGFRLLAVFGVVLLAVYAPRLAHAYGRDRAKAFVLVALSPLVLLHLVGGEHNDALMAGLLVAGLALAQEGHKLRGLLLCVIAGLIKAPAFAGALYIGWDWAGVGVPWRARLMPLVKAMALAGAATVAITYAVGFGWGWLSALLNPGTVPSWMDPADGIGGLIARIVNGVGLGEHSAGITQLSHDVGLTAAATLALWLLLRADGGVKSLRALGLTLIAVVALGPAVQPWYLVWGLVLLAPIVGGRARSLVVAVSAVMSFLGLPGGRRLLAYLEHGSVLVIATAVVVLAVVLVLTFAPRLRDLARQRRRVPAVETVGVGP